MTPSQQSSLSRAQMCRGFAATMFLTGLNVAPGRTQERLALRVGTTGSDTYSEVYYGAEKGFFRRAGLNVTIETFNNGAAASAAVASGAIDIGVSSPLQVAQAFAHGVPFVLVAAGALNTEKEPSALLLVSSASTAKKASDLEGKVVAVNALKTASEEALDAWLGQSGVDISKVRTVEMPFSEMGAALRRGTVDAAVLAEPTLSTTLNSGTRILANPTLAVARQYLLSSWFAMRTFAEANPDLIKRFASAIYDSGRWANANRSESAVILAEHAKLDVSVTTTMRRVQYAEALRVPEIQNQLDVALKFGMISKAVSARDILLA